MERALYRGATKQPTYLVLHTPTLRWYNTPHNANYIYGTSGVASEQQGRYTEARGMSRVHSALCSIGMTTSRRGLRPTYPPETPDERMKRWYRDVMAPPHTPCISPICCRESVFDPNVYKQEANSTLTAELFACVATSIDTSANRYIAPSHVIMPHHLARWFRSLRRLSGSLQCFIIVKLYVQMSPNRSTGYKNGARARQVSVRMTLGDTCRQQVAGCDTNEICAFHGCVKYAVTITFMACCLHVSVCTSVRLYVRARRLAKLTVVAETVAMKL